MKRLPIHHVTFTKKLLKLVFYSVLQIQRTMLLFNLEFILSNNKSRRLLNILRKKKNLALCGLGPRPRRRGVRTNSIKPK